MYNRNLHIHFVGIGGIGMSGIALILNELGHTVSGCDANTKQPTVTALRKKKCRVYEGNNTAACADKTIDVIVHSTAIKVDNPELVAARNRGIPTVHRAHMLAELMRRKQAIAVTGSHGKTTTSSLLAHLLIKAQLDPTVIVGGHMKNIEANARFGNGDLFIAEADESDRSLLQLPASLAILTNIDLEHLETYTDLADITQTFKQFLAKLPWYGKAVVCADDKQIRSLLPLDHPTIITYGIDTPHVEVSAYDIVTQPTLSEFTVTIGQEKKDFVRITLNMPGRHNVLNALATIALARELNVPREVIADACATFTGVERRFSYQGVWRDVEIFDDYGHHPVELHHALLTAKKRTRNRLIVVFQPHRYTRTAHLWDEFINVLYSSPIDHLIITDIYAASEQPIATITSQRLTEELKTRHCSFPITYVPYTPNMIDIQRSVTTTCTPNDLLLLLGAGNINTLANYLVR